MSPPGETEKPAPAGSQDGQEFLKQLEAAINSPLGQALIHGGFDSTALELIASILHLSTLARAPRPITAACRLKHDAEMQWPTAAGYVSEDSMLRAAVALGIEVRDGHVAVRLPKRPRGKRRATT